MSETSVNELPLHKRSTVEIFDVSIKLYKKYFSAIIPWSILCGGLALVGAFLGGVSFASFLCTPILLAAVMCCIEAALEGRSVNAKECWSYSKARYKHVLMTYIAGSLLGVFIILAGGIILVIPLGYAFFSIGNPLLALGAAGGSIIAATLFVVVTLIFSVILTGFFAWIHIAPMAACMESDFINAANNKSRRFLRRSYDLMKGNWWKVFGLVSLIGIAIIFVFMLAASVVAMVQGLSGIKDLLSGQISDNTMMQMIFSYFGAYSVVSIILMPFFYIALAVQYLDLRVRKEAFDLEWAAREKVPPLPEDPPTQALT